MLDFGAAREVLSKEGNFIRPMYTPGFAAPEMYRRDGSPGAVDRHLRHRCVHLRLHAGLPAQRRAAAHREGPPGPVPVAPAQCVLGQPHRGDRVVHVAGRRWRARRASLPCRRNSRARPSAATPSSASASGSSCSWRISSRVPRPDRPGPPPRSSIARPVQPHAFLRLPDQPPRRPREERGPHGLLLHARLRACSRWPTAWAVTRRARWPRRCRCRPWRRMFQREAKPVLKDPRRFLQRVDPGRPPRS